MSAHGAHSVNFDEKVHKHQSKSYSRIGAHMQLIFTHILWIWIPLSLHHNFLGSEELQGTHIDALNPFSSKLMALTLRGGLWTFLANLALCASYGGVTERRKKPKWSQHKIDNKPGVRMSGIRSRILLCSESSGNPFKSSSKEFLKGSSSNVIIFDRRRLRTF